MTSEIKFIQYSSKYKSQTLDLLSYLWTHLDKAGQRECFEWRYEKNPFIDKTYIYLAIHADKAVGFRAFVPQILVYDNSRITGLTAADAIVHPEYRRQGIFSGLIHTFLQDIGGSLNSPTVIYNLSSNEYSTPGYLKRGWQATNGIKRFALRYAPLQHLSVFFQKQSRSAQSFDHYQLKDGQLEISNKVYAEEMAGLTAIHASQKKIKCIRNGDYFKWRYSFNKEAYIYVYYRSGGELQSYLVLKKVNNTQYLLWEYAAKDARILGITIKKAVRKIGIPFLRSWVLSGNDVVTLRQSGFVTAPVQLWKLLGKERLPVLVRPVNEQVFDQDFFINGSDIRDINNWQLYLADRH